MERAPAHRNPDADLKATLYVVATPIGNLRDITARAIDVLKHAALIAAEDTRVTAKLLEHYGISTELIAFHAHNEKRVTPRVLDRLAAGGTAALVTDAGTPAISDPGAHLVAAARAAGYAVTPIPGPNAAVTALSAAGYKTPHFLFYGFLPARTAQRRGELERLAVQPFTLVFYEAPHRVAASVADMADTLGADRRVVIARELTKLHESIHVCALGEALRWLDEDANRVRGEFVLIVEGAAETGSDANDTRRVLETLLCELPLRQAVALAAKLTGGRRNELYEMALSIQKKR